MDMKDELMSDTIDDVIGADEEEEERYITSNHLASYRPACTHSSATIPCTLKRGARFLY